MKTYKFAVSLCGGWCNGNIEIVADNEEVAHEMVMDHVVKQLVDVLPTLDIEYDVECQNPDEETEKFENWRDHELGVLAKAFMDCEDCNCAECSCNGLLCNVEGFLKSREAFAEEFTKRILA